MAQTRLIDIQECDTFPLSSLPNELFLTILQLLENEDLQNLALIAQDIYKRVQLEQRGRWLLNYEVKDLRGASKNSYFLTRGGGFLFVGDSQGKWLKSSCKIPQYRYPSVDKMFFVGDGLFLLDKVGGVVSSVKFHPTRRYWEWATEYTDLQPVCSEAEVRDVFISSYGARIFYLTKAGEVFVHGVGVQGQLGIDGESTRAPKRVDLSSVVEVFPFKERTFFKCQNGLLYACGQNLSGALGLSESDLRSKDQLATPATVSVQDVISVFSKGNNTFFLREDGRVWGCGENNGELGLEFDYEVLAPLELPGLSNIVKMIGSANSSQIYFINKYGQVFVMGQSQEGKLALGIQTQAKTPQKIAGLWGVEEILQDESWVLFVLKAGKVYASGAINEFLPCQHLYRDTVFCPEELPELKGLKCVVSSSQNDPKSEMLLMKDGSVYVLGKNQHGYLGCDGEEFDQLALVRFPEVEAKLDNLSLDELICLSRQGDGVNFARCLVKALERILAQDLRNACCDVLDAVIGRRGVRDSVMRQNPVLCFPGLHAMFGSSLVGFRAVADAEKYAYASLLLELWKLKRDNLSPTEEAYRKTVSLFNMLLRQEEDGLGLWREYGFAQDEHCQLNVFASVARRMADELGLQGLEHLKRSRDNELDSELQPKRLKLG